MIPKKWKDAWLDKHEESLAIEFESSLNELKSSFHKTLDEWNVKKSELETSIHNRQETICFQEKELDEISKRLEVRRQELNELNEDLKRQIVITEKRTSPSSVWTDAFTSGFNKAWEMMMPLMMDGVLKSKKFIEDQAIQETIRRNNGNYKKNN